MEPFLKDSPNEGQRISVSTGPTQHIVASQKKKTPVFCITSKNYGPKVSVIINRFYCIVTWLLTYSLFENRSVTQPKRDDWTPVQTHASLSVPSQYPVTEQP